MEARRRPNRPAPSPAARVPLRISSMIVTIRSMTQLALTAIGRDRPGIVAEVTRALLGHSLNITDSHMGVLGGRFSMMLIVEAPEGRTSTPCARSSPARARGSTSTRSRCTRWPRPATSAGGDPSHIVTVYGVDHPGIVHAVSARLASKSGQRDRPGDAARRRRPLRDGARDRAAARRRPGGDGGDARRRRGRAGRRGDRPAARVRRHGWSARSSATRTPRSSRWRARRTTPPRSRGWARISSTRWTRSGTASDWRPRSWGRWCAWWWST